VHELITKDGGKPSFIDAGCGCGNILVTAVVAGFNVAHGIEIDSKTAELARKFMQLMCDRLSYKEAVVKIIEDDIVTFKHYNKYNCIYVYQPIYRGQPTMLEFLKRLSDKMRFGAYVIFNNTIEQFHTDSRFTRISDNIYKKVKRGKRNDKSIK